MIAAPRQLTQQELQSLDANFYLVNRLRGANDNRERAAMLLRLPDEILMSQADELAEICVVNVFSMGADFIHVRKAALSAKRLPTGELPVPMQQQLQYWRSAFVAAAQVKP